MSVQNISESLHYNGKIKLIYNETNPRLRYQVSHLLPDNRWSQPRVISGVSSILDIGAKHWLKPWVAMMVTLGAIKTLDQAKIAETQQFIEASMAKWGHDPYFTEYEALKLAKKKFEYLKTISTWMDDPTATTIGTDAHNALEAYVLGKDYTIETEGGANALESWKKLGLTFSEMQTEVAILSRQFSYAGRYDLKGRLNGKLLMTDWKTSKRNGRFNPTGAKIENFYQMGGYAWAVFEETGEWVDDLAIINVDKFEGKPAIITFASDFNTTPEECASQFLAMKTVVDNGAILSARFNEAKL